MRASRRAGPWRWRSAGWLDGNLREIRGHDRVVSLVRGKRSTFGPVKGRTYDGVRFAFEGRDSRDGSVRALIALQYRSTTLEPVLRAALNPGDCCYDIGANIGLYAVRAAQLVGRAGQVYAFEPAPYPRRLLGSLIAENAVNDGTTVVATAVSGQSGQLSLRTQPGASGLSFTPMETEESDLTVPAITIDEFAREHRPPHLVKVDVEGHEVEVIRGALDCLESHRPVMVLEVIDSHLRRAGSSVSELQALLAENDYSLWYLTQRGLSPASDPGSQATPNALAVPRKTRRGDHLLEQLRETRFRRNQTE